MIDLQQTFKGQTGRDEFKREQVADRLITLLSSDIDISPMIIDGDWGTGKTEFCCKLVNKFRAEKNTHKILYIDAFQADHADNPLMTILAEVASIVPSEKKEGFFNKALPVIRYGFKTVAKAGVSYLLKENADDIAEGLDDHLQNAADSAIDASVMAVLKDHEKAKENLQALQTLLAELAKEHPIVIFIDELDRCRPDFAVQMLEVIKHTFNVEGVQFVLVTNTKQLRAAINHAYGFNVDAQRYLDKFIKFSFALPSTVPGMRRLNEDLQASVHHFHELLKKSDVLESLSIEPNNGIWAFLSDLICHNNLSLREVETLVRNFEIYLTLANGRSYQFSFGYSLMSTFAIFLFSMKPNIKTAIINNEIDEKSIADVLNFTSQFNSETGFTINTPSDVIGAFLCPVCKNSSSSIALKNKFYNQNQLPNLMNRYFDDFAIKDNERFDTIKKTFEVMSLGTVSYF